MNKSTTSLIFPDVNVWLALSLEHHIHNDVARAWWAECEGRIAFLRFTEIGFLRLLTTSAAMDQKPLTVDEAWRVRDRFFEDSRVTFVPEPVDIDYYSKRRHDVL